MSVFTDVTVWGQRTSDLVHLVDTETVGSDTSRDVKFLVRWDVSPLRWRC